MPRQNYNSPTLAYIAVYGKEPDEFIRGRTDEPKKTWNGLSVDANIKDEWLEELNNIDGIEIRATDEGKSETRVAFVVFRLTKNESEENAKKVSLKLKSKHNVFSLVDLGSEGRPRIIVAGKTWVGKSDWNSWWNNIAKYIQEAVSEIQTEKTESLNILLKKFFRL